MYEGKKCTLDKVLIISYQFPPCQLTRKQNNIYYHYNIIVQYFVIVFKVKNQLLSVLYEIYRYVDRVVDYIDDISENACNIQLVS